MIIHGWSNYPYSKKQIQMLLGTLNNIWSWFSEKGEKDCGQTIAKFLVVWLAHFSKCFFCWPYHHSESNFGIPKWLIYLDYSYIMSVLFCGAVSHGFWRLKPTLFHYDWFPNVPHNFHCRMEAAAWKWWWISVYYNYFSDNWYLYLSWLHHTNVFISKTFLF